MLSDKQQRFANEYLVDMNATRADVRAGYSPRTAKSQASRLLSKVLYFVVETTNRAVGGSTNLPGANLNTRSATRRV